MKLVVMTWFCAAMIRISVSFFKLSLLLLLLLGSGTYNQIRQKPHNLEPYMQVNIHTFEMVLLALSQAIILIRADPVVYKGRGTNQVVGDWEWAPHSPINGVLLLICTT